MNKKILSSPPAPPFAFAAFALFALFELAVLVVGPPGAFLAFLAFGRPEEEDSVLFPLVPLGLLEVEPEAP